MRELVSQGIQGTLLIHVGTIVLTETIDALYYSCNKRVSTPRIIEGCRQKECPRQTIRRPDNKDNKNKGNNEVQSTMVTTMETVIVLL